MRGGSSLRRVDSRLGTPSIAVMSGSGRLTVAQDKNLMETKGVVRCALRRLFRVDLLSNRLPPEALPLPPELSVAILPPLKRPPQLVVIGIPSSGRGASPQSLPVLQLDWPVTMPVAP